MVLVGCAQTSRVSCSLCLLRACHLIKFQPPGNRFSRPTMCSTQSCLEISPRRRKISSGSCSKLIPTRESPPLRSSSTPGCRSELMWFLNQYYIFIFISRAKLLRRRLGSWDWCSTSRGGRGSLRRPTWSPLRRRGSRPTSRFSKSLSSKNVLECY